MLNAAYKFNTEAELHAYAGWNNKKGNAAGFFQYPNSIPLLNATAVAATELPPTVLRENIASVYPHGFLPEINSDETDFLFAVGLRGKIGESWNYDLSNVYGKNIFDYGVDNSVNYTQALSTTNFQRKFDAGGNSFAQNTTNLDLSRKYNDILSGFNLAFGAEFKLDEFGTRAGELASYNNYNEAAVGIPLGSQVFAGFFPKRCG